ncbi:N-acetylmuramoyl-L-alanine amidase family protein [Mucilaginibacter paludis]|nr:N-acetylmuramoyl-L-alanine amidase [Mucilaginibacter paludis]
MLTLAFSSNAQQKDQSVPTSFKFKTVVIDAGHGGKDPGAHGAISLEKNVALAIAKKLEKAIEAQIPDVNVVMTRSTDKFIELNKRSEIANKNGANLFISIHCNSSPQIRADNYHKGVLLLVYGFHRNQEQMEALRENASIYIEKNYKETYSDYNENDPTAFIALNAFRQKYRKQSVQFAELINQQFTANDGRRSLGVKEQGVLVLAHSAMPAVLVETGFINNISEEKYLNSDEGQQAIVHSIVAALIKYKTSMAVR